ncbi:20S proteasome subunit [Ectocarpus siliculosus]|uniref:20S proteasome subunit n=1 Tax=Ectocarpus siliculosus TaxID=2880 RepID=D8LEW0_ECTSI|nr:20S proteasome subunit [Ectocarpus siliculosus]|eukprot:CBN79780.1 20S proteasome subunit [Ectocarpus siliculosus]
MRAPIAVLAVILAARPCMAAVYDRAITVFSPDGKLMQVSYAEEAVKQGSLGVAACNGRDAIAMCLERPAADGDITDPDATPSRASETTVATSAITDAGAGAAGDTARAGDDHVYSRRRNRRKHHEGGVRDPGVGVGIVDSANNQDRKLCEIDEGVYLAFAGISADGRVLASKIRLECQSYRYSMGAAPSVGYIARYVGELQHRYTRTGGARPYGVACLVAGFDEDTLLPSVFRSEPSGAYAEWTASAVGKASDKALGRLEAVPDLGALDWRGTAEAAVRAALAGGAKYCDVLVLRRVAGDDDVPAAAEAVATEPPESEFTAEGGGEARSARAGWSHRGGAWSKRFLGSIGGDGAVLLEEGGSR